MFWFKRDKPTPSVSEVADKERRERLDRLFKKLFEMQDKGSIKTSIVTKPNCDVDNYEVGVELCNTSEFDSYAELVVSGNYNEADCAHKTTLYSGEYKRCRFLSRFREETVQPSLSIQKEFWDRFIVPNIESAKDKLYNEYKDELEKYDVVESQDKEK